ncbi:MAG TPA: Ig-like domain-containing protein, partial [Acidobacteriota bacterium]|nr:Ig-like domain-containing protein [Acidobacteriota bacterium]
PILAAIGPKAVQEDQLLTFGISATDADETIPVLTTSALPTGASFIDNLDGTGTFSWTPDFTQAGDHFVTFYATDDSAAVDSEIVTIAVGQVNLPPILAAIGPKAVQEDQLLTFGISATDADETIPVLMTSALPTGASFIDNLDGTGTFNWTPDFTQAGDHFVTFYATDDSAVVDSEVVTITVFQVNVPPILAAIGPQSVFEGQLLTIGVSATDLDATIPVLTTSTLPTGASFTDNLNGTGTFNWTPDFIQSGDHFVTFYATDDSAAVDSEVVTITVVEAGNQTPVLAPIGPKSVAEADLLSFSVSASDPDSTIPALSTSTLPAGANFVDIGDGTGTFDWIPGYDQAGPHEVTFYAADGFAVDSEIITITVVDVNRPPVADAGFDQFTVPANSPVTLDGTGSFDPDGDVITYQWLQIGGPAVSLSSDTAAMPTFTPGIPDDYFFELTVSDGPLFSGPDTVLINVVNGAPPLAVNDLAIQIVGDNIDLSWSAVSSDTSGFAITVDRYVVYRGTSAYFNPTPADSIGATDGALLSLTDDNIGGVNVVGDTLNQYFYVVQVVDIYGNRSAPSNRVGEYDYQLLETATTNYNLVAVPFANTGITTADDLITAIGSSNVFTVNQFIPASQSYQSRFAAGFGVNFAVIPGGIYQVNAATDTLLSVAGDIPDSGTVSYTLITTATTDFGFMMIPFELESDFSVAQDVIDAIPGVLNTLNNFVASSQSYVSRFAAGFGTNFTVRAGKPYQANVATDGTFPGP